MCIAILMTQIQIWLLGGSCEAENTNIIDLSLKQQKVKIKVKKKILKY